MKNAVILLAAGFLLASQHEAQAATFSPDMWVYEVTYEPAEIIYFRYAQADAPLGTPIPEGCTGGDVLDPPDRPSYTFIQCNENPGIDLFAELGGIESFRRTGIIGFNASHIVCSLIGGCPAADGSGNFYSDFFLDYVGGRLSFCGGPGFAAEYGCYNFAPEGVTFGGEIFRNIGTIGGSWDIGFDGFWIGNPGDNYVLYSATGRLVASPVPLPASVSMLGAALLGLGALSLRKRAAGFSQRVLHRTPDI